MTPFIFNKDKRNNKNTVIILENVGSYVYKDPQFIGRSIQTFRFENFIRKCLMMKTKKPVRIYDHYVLSSGYHPPCISIQVQNCNHNFEFENVTQAKKELERFESELKKARLKT